MTPSAKTGRGDASKMKYLRLNYAWLSRFLVRGAACIWSVMFIGTASLSAVENGQATVMFHAGVGGPNLSEPNGDPLAEGSEVRVGILPETFDFARSAANPKEVGQVWRTLGTGLTRPLFGQPGRYAISADISDRALVGRKLFIWILRSANGLPVQADYGNVSAHALLTSVRANWRLPSVDALPPDNLALLALGEVDQIFAGVKAPGKIELMAGDEQGGLTYDSWALVMIGPGNHDPSIDLDGDGLANLLEFVLGGDPLHPDHFNPVLVARAIGGKTFLEMSFELPRNRLGTNWVVEASSDLKIWAPVTNVTVTNQGNGTHLVVARDSITVEKAGRHRFMRLNVSP